MNYVLVKRLEVKLIKDHKYDASQPVVSGVIDDDMVSYGAWHITSDLLSDHWFPWVYRWCQADSAGAGL